MIAEAAPSVRTLDGNAAIVIAGDKVAVCKKARWHQIFITIRHSEHAQCAKTTDIDYFQYLNKNNYRISRTLE